MPPSVNADLAELALLVPDAAIDGDAQIMVAGVASTLRVRPSTVRELEQIVGWASDRGMAMAAIGGGTKLGIGNPPSHLDLVVDTSALDSIVDYDPENLVLTAEAGATIERLKSTAREDSLLLPLDPQSGERATIGGVIACAEHGPRRRQHGGLRDLLLGLKVVLPDGSVASFGGRTLKNVAGYDVGKLFIGSLGTIGVIAEATVRLLPLPTCEELLLISLPHLEAGRRLVARILDSPLLPSSLEFMSHECAALLGLDLHSTSDSTYLMLIALEGHSAAVERQVRDISLFCAEVRSGESQALGRGTPGTAHEGAAEAGAREETVECCRASEAGLLHGEGWSTFAKLRERALSSPSSVGLRGTVPLGLVWDVAAAVESNSRANGVAASYTMSCGTGYLEAYAAGASAGLRAFAEGVRAAAEQRGGAMSVLSGWSELGQEFDAWGGRRTDYELIRAVKQRFDPGGVMNPGRFVGGL